MSPPPFPWFLEFEYEQESATIKESKLGDFFGNFGRET